MGINLMYYYDFDDDGVYLDHTKVTLARKSLMKVSMRSGNV